MPLLVITKLLFDCEVIYRRCALLQAHVSHIVHFLCMRENEKITLRHTAVFPELGLIRTEISTLSHQVRYKQEDYETMLNTLTDDPSIIPPVDKDPMNWKSNDEIEKHLEQKNKELNSQPTLFNIAESLFNLPEYFNFKLQYVSTDEIKTRYGKNKAKMSTSKIYKYAPTNLKVFIRKTEYKFKSIYIGAGINLKKSPDNVIYNTTSLKEEGVKKFQPGKLLLSLLIRRSIIIEKCIIIEQHVLS